MAANLDPILTIADLDAMPDDGNRYELIEGELSADQFIVPPLALTQHSAAY